MSEPFVFDSRCELCKSPFGAIPCRRRVQFRVRPLIRECFTHCALVLSGEFSGLDEERELHFDGYDGDRVRFALDCLVPQKPDLIWYHFRFWRDDGSGCFLDRTGYRSDSPDARWQLTVWDDSRSSPAWFGGGTTYQIFPDRFCRLEIPSPAGLVGNRWVHEDWSDTPEWRPDADGEIRNRDFFGGSLAGIISKLPYLASLGVTTLYLNPIFESASNHRYNTADYEKIDPMLGTEADFRELCTQAEHHGIRILLDGVFNHTGSQSLYFNVDGYYPTLGATQSQASPYYNWFSFHPWPDDFDSWWGIRTLPAVREEAPEYVDFMIGRKDSIIRRWLNAGASGWRLDVADELPDWFIERIRAAMDEVKPGSFLLGEVWEDASTKVAYSQRRKYLLGSELHGVMNYPFRNALLAYLGGGNAEDFVESMETLRENYPAPAYYSAMNFLGTHDTARILTVLGAERVPESKDERASYRLSPAEREKGIALVRLAAMLLFTFPGAPTIYYGDELGMEGFEDPFNRAAYPWEQSGEPLLPLFRSLGRLRRRRPSLQRGKIRYLAAAGPLLAFARETEAELTITVLNAGTEPCSCAFPVGLPALRDVFSQRLVDLSAGQFSTFLPPRSGFLFTEPAFTGDAECFT